MNDDFFRELGWDCFYSGGSINDNPYPETDVRHWKWREGFNNAKFNSQL